MKHRIEAIGAEAGRDSKASFHTRIKTPRYIVSICCEICSVSVIVKLRVPARAAHLSLRHDGLWRSRAGRRSSLETMLLFRFPSSLRHIEIQSVACE